MICRNVRCEASGEHRHRMPAKGGLNFLSLGNKSEAARVLRVDY
jgi:hypothetical protein